MILFVNVMLTDKVFNVYYHGRRAALQNKVEVFKYTLASYSVIPWEHVVIYVKLDSMYEHRRSELEGYINQLFPGAKYYAFRNERQVEWQRAVTELASLQSDGLVWFTCNDDHVFIDYDLQALNQLKLTLLELQKEHLRVGAAISHWPEYVPYIQNNFKGSWENYTTTPIFENEWCYAVHWNHAESIQIVNLALLKTWWFDKNYGDVFAPRTDSPNFVVHTPMDVAGVIPKRELVKHYDGYSHVKADLNRNPPLFIPDGFFEGDIKINYCSEERKSGFVNVNPFAEFYFNVHPGGVDLKCSLEDLPLFWRSRISKIEIGVEHPPQDVLAARNARKYESASEFWPVSFTELSKRYTVSFRVDEAGEFHLGKVAEAKSLDTYSLLKLSLKKPKLSVVLVERRLGLSGRNSLSSILRQLGPREDFEVSVVGVHGGHDPEMLVAADTYLTLSSRALQQGDTYSIAAAYNIAAAHSNGALIAFSDTYSVFPPTFVSTVLNSASSLLGAGGSFMLRVPEESLGVEGAITLFQQPLSTLVVAAQDLMKACGFDEAPEMLGEKFALFELAGRLSANGCKDYLLPSSALVWRIPDNQYRFINPPQYKPLSLTPRVVSPEFVGVSEGLPVAPRAAPPLSELEVLNRILLSGDLQKVLQVFDVSKSAPDTRLVLAAINDQLTGINRGEFERLEAATEKAGGNRAALSTSVALLLFFKGQFAAAEQWIRHGLSNSPLYAPLWLLLCEVKVALKSPKQEVLGVALEGVRSFPGQPLFFQRALQALQS